MAYHIICQVGEQEEYKPITNELDQILFLSLPWDRDSKIVQTDTFKVLSDFGVNPSHTAIDLFFAALSVYVADTRVLREKSYDSWTRDFVLHLSVFDPDKWENSKEYLSNFLSFLTGDRWSIIFRKRGILQGIKSNSNKTHIDGVSLFSGGLDSFAGAIDLLESNKSLALVGHHSSGITFQSQKNSYSFLSGTYNSSKMVPFWFYADSPKSITQVTEMTQRSRSFLFMSLAVLISNGYGDAPIYIPENGFITLNIPLTNARAGSCSTKTTHPYTIDLFKKLLYTVGLNIVIETPYHFKTKGEILRDVANQRVLKAGISSTLSCSHTGVGRYSGGGAKQHCGYCIPCIIRRASLFKVNLDNTGDYFIDIINNPPDAKKKRGSDLRAIKMAIERYNQSKRLPIFNVLESGPIPGSREELLEFSAVYMRGLKEIEKFLNNNIINEGIHIAG